MSGILVLGGARSGKSAFAEKLVLGPGRQSVYLATARADDEEMNERIFIHRARRGSNWLTIEEPLALVDTLRNEGHEGRAVLVDCLTLWLSNLMMAGADIECEFLALSNCVDKLPVPVVFVSNEVGQGIVPIDRMAREFRDHAGWLHQLMASKCNEVWFLTAGLPQRLK